MLCPSPDQAAWAISALTGEVKLSCAGNVPLEVVPHLCGATLLAGRKKDSGHHHIAVGEVLRCLVKMFDPCYTERAFRTLTPLQVGMGMELGCEAIVHSVTRVLGVPSISSGDYWTLLLDFSSTFNSVDLGCMFHEIPKRIPSLESWIKSCYGGCPILHLGDETILSSCSAQQGDPLGLLGFFLTIQPP